jgi:hypothetical protein
LAPKPKSRRAARIVIEKPAITSISVTNRMKKNSEVAAREQQSAAANCAVQSGDVFEAADNRAKLLLHY